MRVSGQTGNCHNPSKPADTARQQVTALTVHAPEASRETVGAFGTHRIYGCVDAPHVRMKKAGFEDVEKARDFGLPYVYRRAARPYDTTTLNYNWQIWNAKAFSIYTDATDKIDTARALEIVEAVLRFLGKNGILDYVCHGGYVSQLLEGHSMVNVKSNAAGFFLRKAEVSARVKQGELLAQIVDPCLGTVIEEVLSPVDGIVFFHASQPILYSHTSLFRIIPS